MANEPLTEADRRAIAGQTVLPGTGANRIVRERLRQIRQEGYLPDGDVGRSTALMKAALSYLGHAGALEEFGVDLTVDEVGGTWPWAHEFFKPGPTTERTLEKAGALIAAAIDALVQEKKNDK